MTKNAMTIRVHKLNGIQQTRLMNIDRFMATVFQVKLTFYVCIDGILYAIYTDSEMSERHARDIV